MAFTSHGHHIPGSDILERRTPGFALCGGPSACSVCSAESALYHMKGNSPLFLFDENRDFQDQAKSAVIAYFNAHKDKSDTFDLTADEVYIVWFSKTLQNWKALASTTVPDGMYYELTFNGDKKELYLDAYKKFHNLVLFPLSKSTPRDTEN